MFSVFSYVKVLTVNYVTFESFTTEESYSSCISVSFNISNERNPFIGSVYYITVVVNQKIKVTALLLGVTSA